MSETKAKTQKQAAEPVPVETPAPVVMRIARQRTVDAMHGGQDSRDSGQDSRDSGLDSRDSGQDSRDLGQDSRDSGLD